MNFNIRKIALAIAFSPTAEAMLAEVKRLCRIFSAQLVLIHIGHHAQEEDQLMAGLLQRTGPDPASLKICWEAGDPVDRILKVCKQENVDLLVAGALKKENLVQYYMGTIARKLMRKAECSFMMIIHPSTQPLPFRNIVVNAEDSPYVEEAIAAACEFGMKDHCNWVHIVRELKLYGLTMAASDQRSEDEYDEVRHSLVQDEITKVEEVLHRIPHENLKVNIKMISGKSGFELSRFAQKKNADLLVVGAPPRRLSILDRVFPHDLEYVFADLPCNILVIQPGRKEAPHG